MSQEEEAVRKAKKAKGIELKAFELGFELPERQKQQKTVRKTYKKTAADEAKEFIRKWNFRTKFQFVVSQDQITQQQYRQFEGIDDDDWESVCQVVFKVSRKNPVQCPICHNLQDEIMAPQITKCGHIYCWPCIIRLLNDQMCKRQCPMCINQKMTKKDLKSCKIVQLPTIEKGQQSKMVLRISGRQSRMMFHPETLEQDLNFSRVICVQKQYILEMLQKQKQQLLFYAENYLQKGEKQWQLALRQAIDINKQKYSDAMGILQLQHQQHRIRNMTVCHLFGHSASQASYLYQQSYGRFCFPHPILKKYIEEEYPSNNDLPLQISSKIAFLQTMTLEPANLHDYRYLSHVPHYSQVVFVELELKPKFLSQGVMKDYMYQMNSYKTSVMKREKKQEQKYNRKVNQQMTRQFQKHKKQLMSGPWPVDNELKNLKGCNIQQNFPQLSPGVKIEETKEQPPKMEIAPILKPTLSLQDDFPEIGKVVTSASMTQQRGPYRKDRRKKKGTQMDITNLVFRKESDQW